MYLPRILSSLTMPSLACLFFAIAPATLASAPTTQADAYSKDNVRMQRVKLLQQLAKDAKYAKGDPEETARVKKHETLTRTLPDEQIVKLMRERDRLNAERLKKYSAEFGTAQAALDSTIKSLVKRELITKAEVLSLKGDKDMAGAVVRCTLGGAKAGTQYDGHIVLMNVGGLWRPAFANVDGEGDKSGIYPELMPYKLKWDKDAIEVSQ